MKMYFWCTHKFLSLKIKRHGCQSFHRGGFISYTRFLMHDVMKHQTHDVWAKVQGADLNITEEHFKKLDNKILKAGPSTTRAVIKELRKSNPVMEECAISIIKKQNKNNNKQTIKPRFSKTLNPSVGSSPPLGSVLFWSSLSWWDKVRKLLYCFVCSLNYPCTYYRAQS